MFFTDGDIRALNERLLEEGVIVRPLGAFGIPEAIRVTVGSEEDDDLFLEILTRILDRG
jgi:histidinol-phosphate aminotransferase